MAVYFHELANKLRWFRISSGIGHGAPKLANEIKGRVSSVDESGRLVSDISIERVADAPRDESTIVKFGDHETVGLHPSDHDQPPSTMVACLGKSGFVEIEIVGISLSEMLGIKAGEPVTIKW